MQQIISAKEIGNLVANYRNSGIEIGFVPTMGALHEGHLSLIEAAKSQTDISICSIFVNPTQFNDPKDFNKYPRTLEKDAIKLNDIGCDILFTPEAKDIYPVPDRTIYNLGDVAKELEGEHRPGHFNGVASVVRKLFEIVLPHKAFFGLKDYQQYLVIKNLVANYNLDVEIIGCPIIRESNGLAMSSRNTLLSNSDFDHASILHDSLYQAQSLYKEGLTPLSISQHMTEWLNAQGANVEYFEIRNSSNLSALSRNSKAEKIALVAAKFGDVRLIDNLIFTEN